MKKIFISQKYFGTNILYQVDSFHCLIFFRYEPKITITLDKVVLNQKKKPIPQEVAMSDNNESTMPSNNTIKVGHILIKISF